LKSAILRDHFLGFQDSFTDIEKKAILISLYDIANSDDEFHKSEVRFFQEISILLGFSARDNTIYRYLEMDRDYIFKSLNNLKDRQKEWYIVTVIAMMHSDGKIKKEELEYIQVYLDKVGISKEIYSKSIDKGKLLLS
jgi:hypothetical protein